MNRCRVATLMTLIFLVAPVYAANPFLDAKDDKPVSAKFRGTEWSDEIQGEEIPLTTQVVTTRVAKMPWGAIFKIELTDLKSRAKKPHEIRPDYFIVTDERIVLLNEEDNDAAVKKISAMDKAPTFEDRDVRGFNSGKLNYEEAPWTTTIEIKGNECTYLASHNSGHFTKIVWKRGSGWLNTRAATARMLMGFVLSARNKLPGSHRVVSRHKNFGCDNR